MSKQGRVKKMINKTIDTFNILYNRNTPTQYDITENFNINGERKYTISNITGVFVNDLILFNDDNDNLLLDLHKVFGRICLESIEKIEVYQQNITMKLVDGTISINF